MGKSEVAINQDRLQLVFRALGLVHEHLLGDFFSPLHAVQLVVGVAVQHRPTQELCQGLLQTTRVRMRERRNMDIRSDRAAPYITLTYVKVLLLSH